MTPAEKSLFISLFNRGGYVLDFTDTEFSLFTMESVNVDLKQKYGLSKGRCLVAFANEASEEDLITLFSALLEHYELQDLGANLGNQERVKFEKCKDLVQKYKKDCVSVETPSLKKIDRPYIKSLYERAYEDVQKGNFDSAFTKSRTMLEEVFCLAVEKQGQKPNDSGDMSKLYNQVKSLYNMHQSAEMDKRINGLLSGLEKIVLSISEMRNKNSDSHGVGEKRINVKDYHALLLVNSAMTVSDFVFSVVENKLKTT